MRIRLLFLFFIASSLIYSENNQAAYESYIELPSHKQFLVFKHYKSYLESPEKNIHLKPDHDLYLSYLHHLSEATRKNLTSTKRGLDRLEKKIIQKKEAEIAYLADYPLEAVECDEDDYFSSNEALPLLSVEYKKPIFDDSTKESPNIDEDHLRESNNALWHDSWSLWDDNTDHDSLITLPKVDEDPVSPPIDSFSMPDIDADPDPSSRPASAVEDHGTIIPNADPKPVPNSTGSIVPNIQEEAPSIVPIYEFPKTGSTSIDPASIEGTPKTEGWGAYTLRKIKEILGFEKTETAENAKATENMAFEASDNEDLIEDEDTDLIDSFLSQITFSEDGRLSTQGYHLLGEDIVNNHLGLRFAHEIADALAQSEGGNATTIYNELKKEIEFIENKRKGKS